MTTEVVTDEQLGKMARRQHDLFRRVRERALDFGQVMRGLQDLIEGRFDAVGGTMTFPTKVDNTLGLIQMIRNAVGSNNLANINSNITPERFPLGQGVREVRLQVQWLHEGEKLEDGARRLATEGHTLENTGELAAFLAQHPEEVKKYARVFALGEASRWEYTDGIVYVPRAGVDGTGRNFGLGWFAGQDGSGCGVLVSVSSK